MKRTLHTVITAAALGLVACIVEFDPNVTANADDMLVVEGTITDGETIIALNLSVRINSGNGERERRERPVGGAGVWVESEAGGSFPAEEIVELIETVDAWGQPYTESLSTGRYRIATGTLDDNTRYRVRIESGGEEYVSTWRPPQATPPVEEIELFKNGIMVNVRLDVTGPADGARSYMWSYEETWETRAELNPTHYYGLWDGDWNNHYNVWDAMYGYNGELQQFLFPGRTSPFYHCWKYERSRQVLVADTKRVSENSLRDHVLFEFPVYDDRLSVLYHLKLNQYAIGDDAFLYLTILKENTDNTGSIFSPIPSEMKGNLTCTTSPETHVIGFVEASRLVVTEVFVDRAGSPYEPLNVKCEVINWDMLMHLGAGEPTSDYMRDWYLVTGILGEVTMGTPLTYSLFSNLGCIDCRMAGGSKTRPDWWPNDHY